MTADPTSLLSDQNTTANWGRAKSADQNYRATVGNFVTIISVVLSAKPSGTSHLVLSRDKKFEGKTNKKI